MSPTLAASDRTIIPFMRGYMFINHQGTNTRPKTGEDERMNMILTE